MKEILQKARSLVISALVSSEAKNDILQFAGKEFAAEPLISSSILSIWSKVKTPKLQNFLELNVEKN